MPPPFAPLNVRCEAAMLRCDMAQWAVNSLTRFRTPMFGGPSMSVAPAASHSSPAWLPLVAEASRAIDALLADATQAVRSRVVADGRISGPLMEAEQHACHGLAWLATYAEDGARTCRLRRAAVGRRPLWRDRGTARRHRRGRVSGADLRRHPDEPGRDRAAARARPLAAADRRAAELGGRPR